MWRRALVSVLGFVAVCALFSAAFAADKKAQSRPEKTDKKKAKAATTKADAAKTDADKKKAEEDQSKTKKTLAIDLKNRKRVYYGKVDSVTDMDKIRVLVVRKVFTMISHYRRIKTERIPRGSARYWIYLARANKAFKSAVKKNALEMKLQLVVEKGNIKAINKKPLSPKAEDKMDVTDKVIKTVRALARG